MIVAVVFVAVALAAIVFAAQLLISRWRRRRPAHLHKDWWSEFEREFRDYAERVGTRPQHPDRPRERRSESD